MYHRRSELSSGTGLTGEYRNPQPASRDTLQVTPASKASDPAENPYYGRDFRRMYPKLRPVTQEELATLLIAAPEQLKCVPKPARPTVACGT